MEFGLPDDLNEEETILFYGDNKKSINKTLNRICVKIREENNEQWLDWIYLDKKRVLWNYKQCSKCGEFRPTTEKYFGLHPKTNNGLQSVCKKCDNLRKKCT